MEVKVRNVNVNIVNKIDEIAKEKNISRNEFLKVKLDEIAFENEIDKLENNYNLLVENLVQVTKEHTKVLSSFIDEFVIDIEDAYNINIDYKTAYKNISELESTIEYSTNQKKDFKVSGVPIDVLNKIDEIAKERNISRNEFMNIYLKQLTYSNSLKLVDEKYKYMIEKTIGLLDFSNRILQLFHNENCIDNLNFNKGAEI